MTSVPSGQNEGEGLAERPRESPCGSSLVLAGRHRTCAVKGDQDRVHPERPKGYTLPRPQCAGRPPKERGGGGRGLEKWASVPGPLFCVTMDVGAKGAGTQTLA